MNHQEFSAKHPCLLKLPPADRELCFEFYKHLCTYNLGMDIPTIRVSSFNIFLSIKHNINFPPQSKFKDHAKILEFLNILCKNNFAMCLGVADYVYVHHRHVGPWLINSTSITRFGEGPLLGKRTHAEEDEESVHGKKKRKPLDIESYSADTVEQMNTEPDIEFFFPQPWLRVNTVLNNRVLHKWLGSILTECLTRCGCYISQICIRFNQMHPASVRKLLEVLEAIGSVELKVSRNRKPTKSLFSKYETSGSVGKFFIIFIFFNNFLYIFLYIF